MLEAVVAKWNNKWSLKHFEWVKKRYYSLSKITCKHKQELIAILYLDFTSNPKLNTTR